MALSRKRPAGYPEISFLSFDALALLASIQREMGLDAVGPVTFSLQTMKTPGLHLLPTGEARWCHLLPLAIQSARRAAASD